MEFKQLASFVAVVQHGSFTKAAEKTYISQPTISTHIRMLEEEFNTRLIIRDTKNLEVTPRGWELYECATHILGLRDNLVQRWSEESKGIVQLGVSTIPSAYIVPEVLPRYRAEHPETYFVVHQSDSGQVIQGLREGLFDVGMVGMDCGDEALECVPFYRDRMVMVTPVSQRFFEMKGLPEPPLAELLKEPMILREQGSGSQKSADLFLEHMGVSEDELTVSARVNDQESIKNLVAGGFGVSIISERAARNLVEENRLLMFELPDGATRRNLYLAFPRCPDVSGSVRTFVDYVRSFYADKKELLYR